MTCFLKSMVNDRASYRTARMPFETGRDKGFNGFRICLPLATMSCCFKICLSLFLLAVSQPWIASTAFERAEIISWDGRNPF